MSTTTPASSPAQPAPEEAVAGDLQEPGTDTEQAVAGDLLEPGTDTEQAVAGDLHEPGFDTELAPRPVVVRRNAGLVALIGACSSAMAIAYLWRATVTAAPLDVVMCVVLAGIGALYLSQLVDARTPLLVADDLGVRVRLGRQWRGLPWEAVATVVVTPRRGPLKDGRLVFAPHSLARALDGLDSRGQRAAALNQKLYGAPLAVPMGLSTRLSAPAPELAAALEALGGPEVVVSTSGRSRPARSDSGRSRPAEADAAVAVGQNEASEQTSDESAPRTSVPLRRASTHLRARVGADKPATVLGNAALLPDQDSVRPRTALPEGAELRRSHDFDLGHERVLPISTLGDPVDALVVDDFVVEPAYDPVIGPELAAARTRVGLSVDELAERTRIRPHVIESIEVDDFAPCGGDFYARGHLRTLARVLGRDPGTLLETFDRRYATAPINARRVFEAELSTGMNAGMRSHVGGPNWALLVGVVLVLVLTWGLVRLFAVAPTETLQPVPALNGSTGVAGGGAGVSAPPLPAVAPTPVRVTLVGTARRTQVVVRDRRGIVVWAGPLAVGARQNVRAEPPVRVRADDAGAVDVLVAGHDQGALGPLGRPGGRQFAAPAH